MGISLPHGNCAANQFRPMSKVTAIPGNEAYRDDDRPKRKAPNIFRSGDLSTAPEYRKGRTPPWSVRPLWLETQRTVAVRWG